MAYNNRGVVYNKQDESNLAIKDFSKAIELKPKFANPYGGRGYAYYAKGEVDLAIEDYNKAIQLKPDFAEVYNNRGLAYFAEGELELAIDDLDKAIESNPNDAEVYYNRGVVWSQMQRWEDAKLDLTVAKIIGKNSIRSFQHINRSVVNFTEIPNVNTPEDIAAMLNPT